ncbi:hypothetical protein PTTG_07105 [Puccinia triticina 1-1 BBBD Race 1]|uniref:Uncharacterized protein n=1 Tax=Puccinia triticina (isolate 1-1 / race 1 (BBBD)) TaxID=630390 RepID=A0A180GCL7_PUCT1|nr:hypothetical protein PTTG_07105 [Puccinia triticina 1-1 BBBD Race 1]
MPARKTLFAFLLVISALAGLASAAPAPASTTAFGDGPPNKPHAVNQLACDEQKPSPKKRRDSTSTNASEKPHAINQLACSEDKAGGATPTP